MTKYYLDGELIRTSKTHDNYKYALVVELRNGKKVVKTCSATIEGASRDYNYWRRYDYNVYVAPITKVNA